MKTFLKQTALFLFLAAGIYICYLTAAIYHQRILKQPYAHKQTREETYFRCLIAFIICPSLVATIIGQILLQIQGGVIKIPWKQCLPVAFLVNVNGFTYNGAIFYASFPAITMAKSCSLLSVIIVGVFFTGVKDNKLKLSRENILIGILFTIGIIIFNVFQSQQFRDVDHPISLFSLGSILLIASIIGDGFLPDLQAQIKSQYKPKSIEMYCAINKYVLLIGLSLAILSNTLHIIINFMINYQQFMTDITIMSVLTAIGELFVYKMIRQFRQHIPTFVIAVRKCLTAIISIFWFDHALNPQQTIGILFVFAAVFSEVYANYQKHKEKKSEPVLTTQIQESSLLLNQD